MTSQAPTPFDEPIAPIAPVAPDAPVAPAGVDDFDSYLALRDQIALLQAKLEAMKPAVVAALAQQGGRLVHSGYEFCVRSRVTYEYSEAVAAAEEACRKLKREEEKSGAARVRSYVEFPFLRAL